MIATSAFVLRDHFAKSVTLEGPVIEVSSVAVAGSQLSSGDYVLKGNVLHLKVEASEDDSLEVNYTAGMQSPDPDIKAAILLHASALFMNPVDSVETLPKASSRLLDPYRSWGV